MRQEMKLNAKRREAEKKNQIFYGLYIKNVFTNCFELNTVFKSSKKFELKKVEKFTSLSTFNQIILLYMHIGHEYYIDTIEIKEI
jgi:hypothetical protein